MNIEVTSASRKEQRLGATAASVFVITREMIRRSGLASIPEVLRLAPGVEVSRVDTATWAISIRGFGEVFSNKILVLVDGRSIYTDIFSGVYWSAVDMPLPEIERIEVIRGPVAATWGANAMNGVINIITRSPRDSEGGTVEAGAGGDMLAYGSAGYSGSLGSHGYYHVFAGYRVHDAMLGPSGNTGGDFIHRTAGFRMEWKLSKTDSLHVEAQGFSGNQRDVINFASPFRFNPGPLLQLPRSDSGGSVLGEWKHVFSDRSSVTVQSYYDRYDLSEAAERLSIGTVDVEAQHHYQVSPQQELVWGGGYRRTDNKSAPGLQLYFNPPHLTTQLVSGFVQDEYLLAGGRLHLIGGARVEEDNYAGMNIQPTARLLWEPNRRYSWWAAVSRAVRTPSLIERDLMTNFLVTDLGHVFWAECHGNPDFRSETLLSYEVGQRVQLRNRLSLDASIFYNLYHDLRTANLSNFYFDQQRGVVVFPVYYVNGLSAHTYGTEIDLTYSATKNWNLTGGYSWLRLIPSDYNHRLGLTETNGPTDRQHEAQLHSEFDLSRTMQLDTPLYYMGSIPAVGIPGHWRADLRWGWRITPKVELSVTGQDLLSASHPEYVFDVLGRSLQVTRGVAGKVSWSF